MSNNSNQLEMVEYAAVVGTIAGAVVAIISGKVVYLAVPLSASVLLSFVNRRRFEFLMRNSTNAAMTRIHRQVLADVQSLQSSTPTLPPVGDSVYLFAQQIAQMQEFVANLLRTKTNPIHQDIAELKEQYTNLHDSLTSVVQYLNSTSLSPRVENLEEFVKQVSEKMGDVSQPPEQWLIAQLEDLKQQVKEIQQRESRGDNRRQRIAEYSQIETWLMSKLDELKQQVREIQQSMGVRSEKSQEIGEDSSLGTPELPVFHPQSLTVTPWQPSVTNIQESTLLVSPQKWHCVLTLKAHSDWLSSIIISPDGEKIISASFDQSVKVWHRETGELIRLVSENNGVIYALALSPNGKLLAQGGAEQCIRLWEIETGALIEVLKEHSGSVRSIAFSPDGQTLASGSYDGTIKLWDIETAKEIKSFTKHSGMVSAIAFSPDSQILASGGGDGIVKLWHWSTGQLLHSLSGDLGVISKVVFHPIEPWLASASSDRTIKLWNLGTRERLYTYIGHTGGVSGIGFSPNGQNMFSSSTDGSIIIWHLATGKQLATITSDSAFSIVSFMLSADGQAIASGGVDGMLKLWRHD